MSAVAVDLAWMLELLARLDASPRARTREYAARLRQEYLGGVNVNAPGSLGAPS